MKTEIIAQNLEGISDCDLKVIYIYIGQRVIREPLVVLFGTSIVYGV